ncbi:hypothetical protein DYBT9275_00151 [Dyadobacter sp. CECT 9275]|uniref:TonB C-terminal domain-containing protein n=1 Tax=Dyadobacter helix TaxID=2822344 RepID=A0A916N266_9BACT|nr:hypothetical protein [Dyadobacter sp. CECT 9275]CAG4988753.1 hypothetical protein DYBT9275_00151 [Dyadobacter sp. CECT 9275]
MKMKLIVILLLNFSIANAQKYLGKTSFKVKGETYNINRIDNGSINSHSRFMSIGNSRNVLKKEKVQMSSKIRNNILNDIITTESEQKKIKDIITAKFPSLINKFKNEKFIVVYYIGPAGDIRELEFLLQDDTQFTPDELYTLEATLKKEYKFKIQNNGMEGLSFVPLYWQIRFN